jgi:SpoIIAA-like
MLQILDITQKNLIATRTNDILGINDYEKIHPLIHNIIRTGKKVRWYFEMECATSENSGGFWEDGLLEVKYSKADFIHADDIDRIAIIGEQKWQKLMYSIMQPFTKARIMYFGMTEKEKALQWILAQEESLETLV